MKASSAAATGPIFMDVTQLGKPWVLAGKELQKYPISTVKPEPANTPKLYDL